MTISPNTWKAIAEILRIIAAVIAGWGGAQL